MSHNTPVRIHVSPSAPLLLALFVMLSSPLLLSALLLAALCHELGHYGMLRRLRARISAVRITALGAEMQVAGRLSYGGELLAAAAGPVTNLLLALPLAYGGRLWEVLYLFAGAQLVLGVFNLLPIPPLDGAQLASCADRVTGIISFGMAALLTLAAAAALRKGGSPFLLLASAALLWHTIAANRGCQTAAKKVK